MRFVIALTVLSVVPGTVAAQTTLVARWPLQSDARDALTPGRSSTAESVHFEDQGPGPALSRCAVFDGRSSRITIPDPPAVLNGSDPFSVAAWIDVPHTGDDVPGDLLSRFDFESRRGLHLGVYSHGGVTNAQAGLRQLHFGIDNARQDAVTDHGQLGTAVFVFSLCVHDGRLYASTCHADPSEAGHVFRFEGGTAWTDLGSPDTANAVSCLTSFNGSLYAASSKYRLAGSALSESENPHPGGRVFRLGTDDRWVACGRVSEETESISSLIEYRGSLYAGSLYKPAGFFRYDGDEHWTPMPTPDGRRVEAMTVWNGDLYATCYDDGLVFRFDGTRWHDAGKIPDATQTYGFAVHRGSLFVSEWPQAHVFRYLGGTSWEDAGKLGSELETMPLMVYNGRMYGGTLPLAQVYRYDGGTHWSLIDQFDRTPDVKYRRAWSMAVFQGRLFVGTLPSGRVLSFEAGRNATLDRAFPAGWHHVAAIRTRDRLRLFLDGQPVAESASVPAADYDLSSTAPLLIGMGAQDHFHGRMADLRFYSGALTDAEVRQLAETR